MTDQDPTSLAVTLEDRLDLIAVGVFMWDALETMRRAKPQGLTERDVCQFIHEQLQAMRPALGHAGPAAMEAFDQVTETLERRFAPMFADYARRQDAAEASLWRRIRSRRETMGALCALAGLLTLPLPIPTSVVCLVLGLTGYAIVGPAVEQRQDLERDKLLTLLGVEQERIDSVRRQQTPALLSLSAVAEALSPIFVNLRAAGISDPQVYVEQVSRYLDWLRERHPERGAFIDAAKQAASTRLAPAYAHAVKRHLAVERGSVWARIFSRRGPSALATAVLCLPLSFLAARFTPLPFVLEVSVLTVVFAAAGSTIPMLWAPQPSELVRLLRAFEHEQVLIDLHETTRDETRS